jgi:hypothetical protein
VGGGRRKANEHECNYLALAFFLAFLPAGAAAAAAGAQSTPVVLNSMAQTIHEDTHPFVILCVLLMSCIPEMEMEARRQM